MSRAAELLGLVAAVQYRRKDGGSWHTMAAFDSPDIAQSYMGECAGAQRPWEYRVIELEPSQTDPPDDICGLCGKAGAEARTEARGEMTIEWVRVGRQRWMMIIWRPGEREALERMQYVARHRRNPSDFVLTRTLAIAAVLALTVAAPCRAGDWEAVLPPAMYGPGEPPICATSETACEAMLLYLSPQTPALTMKCVPHPGCFKPRENCIPGYKGPRPEGICR